VIGTYGIAVISSEIPGVIVGARRGSPLIIGIGENENFLTSDSNAVVAHTKQVVFLNDYDVATVTAGSFEVHNLGTDTADVQISKLEFDAEDSQRGDFEHFMLKEIFEGPNAIHNTLLGALDLIENGEVLPRTDFQSVKLVACGSSYHAAMVGKYAMEEFAGVPTTLELASEYRYSPGARETPLVILITQSGETADTLAAAREAKRRGCHTLAVTKRGRLDDHQGGGRGAVHPRWAGDRGGSHEDLPHPTSGHVPGGHTHRLWERNAEP